MNKRLFGDWSNPIFLNKVRFWAGVLTAVWTLALLADIFVPVYF